MTTVAAARRRVRVSAGIAVVWCAALWGLASFVPVYSGEREPGGGRYRETLIAHNGAAVVFALAVPVAIAALAWVFAPTRFGRATSLTAAALMAAFIVASILSVGIFYLPALVALAFAAGGVVAAPSRQPQPT